MGIIRVEIINFWNVDRRKLEISVRIVKISKWVRIEI